MTVQTNPSRAAGTTSGRRLDVWRAHARELYHYRFLLRNLIERDLKVRYKNSLLGVLWSLLNPLGMMLVFTLVFGVFAGEGSPAKYPVFVLVGLLPWNFFSGSVISGTNAVIGNGPLVKKVYFPRELLPIASVFANLVNFLIAFGVLIIFLYASGIELTVYALWAPALLATQIIFTLGLVMLLSALHVFYRDIAMILDVGMLAWFFLTPVVYPLEQLARSIDGLGGLNAAQVMRWLNPMASIIDGYRTILWGTLGSQGVPANMDPAYLLRTLITSLVILGLGYAFFRRTEYLFGEKL